MINQFDLNEQYGKQADKTYGLRGTSSMLDRQSLKYSGPKNIECYYFAECSVVGVVSCCV